MALINGNSGSNFLFGTGLGDEINGRGGNDFIFSGGGDDLIRGGNGNDFILAGSGNDTVRGGNGDDLAFGGSGDDRMVGGRGSDVMFGGAGDDTFVFRADRNVGENDFYSGGSGNDRLVIRLNEDEAQDAAINADLTAFDAFLREGGGGVFTFASLGLTVSGIEELVVRGGTTPPPPPPPENTAPVANDDFLRMTSFGDAAPIDVLRNDTDADEDLLTILSINNDTSLDVSIVNIDGFQFITVDAEDGTSGTFDFEYTISDGNDGFATATVVVEVNDLMPV